MLTSVAFRAPFYEVALVDVFSRGAFLWAEAVCWLLRRMGKPYVLVLRGGALPDFLRVRPQRGRGLFEMAAAVVAPSNYLKQEFTRFRSDLVLIPNAIDLGSCQYRTRGPVQPRLIWLRAFHRVYAPHKALETLALLKPRFPGATLLMVGGDKGDGSLVRTQRLAEDLKLSSSVTFTGAVEKRDVPRWLNQGDIFLNTTTVDNTPVSVIEALACGLCVVTTDPGGIRYLLEEGKTALLVPVSDAHAMAAAVERLLLDPSLAARLSGAGRALVEPFDWGVVLPLWESLLLSAARSIAPSLPQEVAP
ncbi:MAG: glycosyltransferase family 4 protein [Bryobacterales bacterium]|nr:glycosyltransferase family 4 protein [Bryobacterales bacterium]